MRAIANVRRRRLARALKYVIAVFPGLAWVTAALYKSATGAVAYSLILCGVLAAGVSFAVLVVALRKLRSGTDTRWVIVSLLFSAPVAILSLIGLMALGMRAMASSSAIDGDTGQSPAAVVRSHYCER